MCRSKCLSRLRRLALWVPVILCSSACGITEPHDQSHLRIWNLTGHWTLTPEVDHVHREPVLPGETGLYVVRARQRLKLVMVNTQDGIRVDNVEIIFPRRQNDTRSALDGSPRYSPLSPVYTLIAEDSAGMDSVVLRWDIRNELD